MGNYRLAMCLAAIFAATPALAAPVYLKCEIRQETGLWPVEFMLDEEIPRVAIIIPRTGHVDQVRGTFLADRVIASNDVSQYEINRVDLTVIRTMPMLKSVDKGLCKVEQLPKRAF